MQRIAEATTTDGKTNFMLPTTPGSYVAFQGGRAYIGREQDMIHVLRREGVVVTVYPERIDWLPKWLNACGWQQPPRARLDLPEGYSLDMREGEFVLLKGGLTLEERYPTEEQQQEKELAPAGWFPNANESESTPPKRGRPKKAD
jgi:hypothetical protein